jgi:hypothetical protein
MDLSPTLSLDKRALRNSACSAFPNLSLTKERSPRVSRAAGEVSLNSAGAQGLRPACENRPLNLSLTLSLDKERASEGADASHAKLLDKNRDQDL